MDPVRKWTLIILGLCVILMGYYLVADRITPYTTQARVHALVVPVAGEPLFLSSTFFSAVIP